MTYIMDSADMARMYKISRTAADLYVKLTKIMYSSILNGVRDRNGHYIYACQKTLAGMIGKSERTVERAVRELKDAGLIWVRRTRHNGHIYFAGDGGSRLDKNGGSNNNNTRKNIDMSIYLDKVQEKRNALAKKDDRLEQISTGSRAPMKDEHSKTVKTAKKDKKTPKRPRISKAQKESSRQKYREHLAKRLGLNAPLEYMMYDCGDEYHALTALADMIADAVSCESRKIAVNGMTLTAEQYWNTVKNIDSDGLYGLVQRIEDTRITTGIRNVRAYTLAAVYNKVQTQRLTRAV